MVASSQDGLTRIRQRRGKWYGDPKCINEVITGRGGNYIMPFLWMHGEGKEIILDGTGSNRGLWDSGSLCGVQAASGFYGRFVVGGNGYFDGGSQRKKYENLAAG